MLLRKKTKESPLKSCFIFLLALVGFVLACFLVCTLIFQINSAAGNKGASDLLTLLLA
jgi:hypothetical protein